MPIHNLDRILCPRSIAVIGASNKSLSVGRTVLDNLIQCGFPGSLFPVNPKYESILGLPAYRSVALLPETPDLAVVCTPAPTAPALVRECGERGVQGMILISAGFREIGAEGLELERQLAAELANFPELRILGPNCLGVIAPHNKLNASFAAPMPQAGRVAFVSQSGALCASVLDWARTENMGFSYFVSFGNAINVKVADLIDYFSEDPLTESIVLYLESVTDARQFMSAARSFTLSKPIVVYKSGRFAQSAQAAASHTGAMAGVDAVYEAAFQRAGMVRIEETEDMFDCAELLARRRMPRGPRLAIVTNAGGPGVMANDEVLQRRGQLADLSQETIERLNDLLPAHWSHGNPVDVLGDASPDRYGQALAAIVADQGVDAALVILTPQAMTDPTECARQVCAVAATTTKPILAAWMGGKAVEEGRNLLVAAGVPTYDFPERAVRAFTYLRAYVRNRDILYETPRNVPLAVSFDRDKARDLLDQFAGHEKTLLSEGESKSLLAAYGVPASEPRLAHSSLEAVHLAREIGYPVVMKIHSPDVSHKTDVGGVALGLSNDDAVRLTFRRITEAARQLRPEARIEGATIQKMFAVEMGVQLIVGAVKDPVFGAVMMVGAGGTTAEVLHDRALELPPLNERLARRMIESLRIWPLMKGFRGQRAVNVDQLVQTLLRLSYLVADNPQIGELDVNPLLVTPDQAVALDARIVLDAAAVADRRRLRPYSHLAIRPYPEEYVRAATLQDGSDVILRPIKPEDEPMWHQLLKSCSESSLWSRFRYTFKETTHEMATRFCFIDYDRTMAIGAELWGDDGAHRLAGVSRLVADADHNEAEFAVLVGDAWQGKGLGALLTDYSLEICRSWGIAKVLAETTLDNHRMQAMFTKRGFEMDEPLGSNEVVFRKHLDAG
jgi:acetyltransferase